MRVRIASPALQPDLLVYLPMETIEVDGETKLREYVSGKHAKFQTIGTWQVVEGDDPFSGSQPTPSLSISEESGTHLAGVPFRLTAQTLLSATGWEWESSMVNEDRQYHLCSVADGVYHPASWHLRTATGESLRHPIWRNMAR